MVCSNSFGETFSVCCIIRNTDALRRVLLVCVFTPMRVIVVEATSHVDCIRRFWLINRAGRPLFCAANGNYTSRVLKRHFVFSSTFNLKCV